MTIAVLSSAVVLTAATPALAFDAGPHTEITESALSAEGFGSDAIGLAEVNNWFCDLYEQASKNPFSGHGGFEKRLAAGATGAEDWPDQVVEAAERCHFDGSLHLSTTLHLAAEWERLQRAVWSLAQIARERNDPEELDALIGISLHEVQDFYAHTNWVEPLKGNGLFGADGPGWHERGYGSYPTWFDVPASVRNEYNMYADESAAHRPHGYWDSDNNESMAHGMNKDWPGRPYYLPAAITAYFASRQWIEAIRSWVNDDVFWTRAQHFHANRTELNHDLQGMHDIQLWVGHWEGQGEPYRGAHPGPGGSILNARAALREYFVPKRPISGGNFGKTNYRANFERLIKRVQEPNPTGQLLPIPSSQDLQRSMRIVVLRILDLHSEGLGDPWPDQADMYANARIDGQPFSSAVIEGHNDFGFAKPSAPFTWFKAVPAGAESSEPVESIEATIRTANVRWAGTNDDVYLRLGPNLRFPLDKSWHDDFERGDSDTYSVPIDKAVEKGMRVGDITEVKLEKSPDGIAGGWKVGGMEVFVNGREIYDNQHIDRWLEDDHRSWVAPNFTPSDPRGQKIPIWLNLRESDVLYGEDDEGDINPYDARDTVSLGYAPGAPVQASTKGGKKLEGRRGIGGDEASIVYRIETLTPELIPTEPTETAREEPREPALLPDLTITGYTASGEITVLNQGGGAAGPFRLKAGNRTVNFDGLPAGASFKVSLPDISCAGGECQAMADDLEQVAESDETNNTRDPDRVIF